MYSIQRICRLPVNEPKYERDHDADEPDERKAQGAARMHARITAACNKTGQGVLVQEIRLHLHIPDVDLGGGSSRHQDDGCPHCWLMLGGWGCGCG